MSILIARDAVREPLWCIVPVHNPYRWKSRWKNADRAIKHYMDAGAVVVLVEVAHNRREFVYADSGLDGTVANCGLNGGEFKHVYVPLHSTSELWLKENMINVGVQHIPDREWEQVCWLDADLHFGRPNWVGETIHKLQHYAFLQMFTEARDLAPNYEMLPEDYPHAAGTGFVKAWLQGRIQSSPEPVEQKLEMPVSPDRPSESSKVKAGAPGYVGALKPVEDECQYYGYYPGWGRVWPGLAWACTRAAWDAIGGLLEIAVWGGGDWILSHALIEKREGMMLSSLHRNYKKICNQLLERCRTHIRRNVGAMDGVVFHSWHGKKTGRGYNLKQSLLAEYGFDPLRHLKHDANGLLQLHDDRSSSYVKIRDMMRRVAAERREDSIDV